MIQTEEEFDHERISTLDNNAMRRSGRFGRGSSSSTARPWYKKRSYQCGILAVLCIVLIIAIAVPVSNNKKAANQGDVGAQEGPYIPPPQVSGEVLQSNREKFGNTLVTYYNTYGLDWNVVLEDESPQQLALDFIAGSAVFPDLSQPRRIQRYVLAVLYYSTFLKEHEDYNTANGDTVVGWTSSLNWANHDKNECDWEGITCENEAVVGILLREHNLSGMLPYELAFLSTSLTTIDLTSNFIYMDGDDGISPLQHLDRVETLLLEDNFIESDNGLPYGMEEMTSLKKFSLSYNLLAGQLDGATLAKLSKLTHLEIESNFLTGDLPAEVYGLQDLLYIYLRANWMEFDITKIFATEALPSLFALWLDDNVVVGAIPGTINSKTDLASISLTNTTLTGSIPSEMGDLPALRRVWLYDNALTGPIPSEIGQLTELEVFEVYDNAISGAMPQEVCTQFATSDYEFKALSSDCGGAAPKVSCTCCTECY